MNRFSLTQFPIDNKKIFLRVDLNVPLEKSETSGMRVADNRKILASLPTIRYLLEKNCTIILGTHLGRPKGEAVPELKVNPVAEELQKLLPRVRISKLDDCIGRGVRERTSTAEAKEIIILENLRFHDEEKKNNSAFAHALASLAEIYVNDAFAVCHRKNASLDAITNFLPAIAGLLVEKELQNLNKALNPRRPAIWIMGGAKLDKVDLLSNALSKADHILLGGALPFAFLKARGIPVGMSKCNPESVQLAKIILKKKEAKKIILPLDFVAADSFSRQANTEIVLHNEIRNDQICLDLGPQTIKLFKIYMRKAHTIVWNGPLGYFELAKFAAATKEIGRYFRNLTATSIAGGGETASAIHKFHLEHHLTHVSTGGGASLTLLSGENLPALRALETNYRKYRR